MIFSIIFLVSVSIISTPLFPSSSYYGLFAFVFLDFNDYNFVIEIFPLFFYRYYHHNLLSTASAVSHKFWSIVFVSFSQSIFSHTPGNFLFDPLFIYECVV